jgi:hypothetical protein
MRDLRRYWDEVREIRAGLPEFVWVVEADGVHPPVEVGSEIAARLLQARSHRPATEEEVRSHSARETASNRQQAEGRLRREGVAIVTI